MTQAERAELLRKASKLIARMTPEQLAEFTERILEVERTLQAEKNKKTPGSEEPTKHPDPGATNRHRGADKFNIQAPRR